MSEVRRRLTPLAFLRYRLYLEQCDKDEMTRPAKSDFYMAQVSYMLYFLITKVHNILADKRSRVTATAKLDDFMIRFGRAAPPSRQRYVTLPKVPTPESKELASRISQARWGLMLGTPVGPGGGDGDQP